MKQPLVILTVGLLVAFAGYCGFYVVGSASHRDVLQSQSPELLWLKKEFNLSDTELKRIAKLHEVYRPHCKEMCRRIDEQNAKLKRQLESANGLTPEVEQFLAEAAQLRSECQRDMLRHFFAVSQIMSPEQGRRYLEWVLERTVVPAEPMSHAKRFAVAGPVGDG